jgi:HEAT repeat protein
MMDTTNLKIMHHVKSALVIVAFLIVVGALALQHRANQRLSSELADLRQQVGSAATVAAEADEARPARLWSQGASDAGLSQRLAALERSVAQLTRASDYLMERGQLPLATNKLEDLLSRLADASAGERDRLQALRLLRRNRSLNDDAVQHAVGLLQSATNSGVREDVLGQLEGLTNAALRGPLLALASADPSGDVREQAIDNLRRFVGDPQVEAQLWQSMLNDPEGDVREQAQEALVESPKSQVQIAALRERALNPNSSMEERAVAWEALHEADQNDPNVSAALAQFAQTTQDPAERLRLFRAFDEANDPAFVPALVQGLQDANPFVRESAADALSDFRSDANIQQWLRYVSENDADPAVRREALQALGMRRN